MCPSLIKARPQCNQMKMWYIFLCDPWPTANNQIEKRLCFKGIWWNMIFKAEKTSKRPCSHHHLNWATACQNQQNGICVQQRQISLGESLIRLGGSESFCWFCQEAAELGSSTRFGICCWRTALSWGTYMSRAMRKHLMSYANNKDADQPAHPRSLISVFVVRCLDSVLSLVSETKISFSC